MNLSEQTFEKMKQIVFSVNPITDLAQTLSNKKEQFSTSGSAGAIFSFLTLLLLIVYVVALLITWIRLVFFASSCGIGEGVAAFFVTTIYTMWKMGTLIKKDCKTGMF